MRHLLSLAIAGAIVAVPAANLGAQQQTAPAPTAAAAPKPISVPYTMFTLPNGLTVILHEDHSVPVASINVWWKVGSANEKPGRTGFAHLFEHLMFEGSKHVKEGEFDTLLEAAGGSNNAFTANDVTDYYIDVPSNALDLALFLESDRLGYLLDIVTPALVDGQRDVVKNERRERVDNAPYGISVQRIPELIYPKNHPYHWPVIGYMEDLTAASSDDVKEFFRKFYTPANAVLSVAGDFATADLRKKIEYWFSDVKAGPAAPPIEVPPVEMTSVVKETVTDKVQLPRLYINWITPATFAPGDGELDVLASVLAGGKTSRLYKRLVYDMQVAQNVTASQQSAQLGSIFQITVTARPSQDAPQVALDKLKAIIDEEIEKLKQEPPAEREMQRVLNGIEANFFSRMEQTNGQATQLANYFAVTGNPDYFNEDLARYRALSAGDIQAAARRWLPAGRRLEFSVVPAAK
jgi:zinc protease